jgi:tRNA A-37 threonylcarbamoyl transferase component Bud32
MNILKICNEVLQYQDGAKKMGRLKNRYDLPVEQYYLLHNVVKACMDYNNYVQFPHKYFAANTVPSTDKVKNCLCNVETYRKVGEGWWAEAYVIDDDKYKPSFSCNSKKKSSSSSSSSSSSLFKYLVKVEHLTRHNVVPWANMEQLTKTIARRYDTLEIAKKAGSLGIGPKVVHGYECVQGKHVYFITVMEFLEGETYVEFHRNHKNEKELLSTIASEIQSKVEKLNKNNILHKDLHGENIIVVQKGNKYTPMLIDFGNAEYARDKNIPTAEDPKDLSNGVDKNKELLDKLIFKLLDEKVLQLR